MYPQPQFDVDSSRTVILDSGPPSIVSIPLINDVITHVSLYSQPTHSSEQPVRHEWTETSNAAISKAIDLLVIEVPDGGAKRFFCGWRECSHTSGFARKAQLLTHIRTVHFSEKPFVCTTWFVSSHSLAVDSASLNYPTTLQRCVVYTKTGRESACGYDEQRYTVRVFFLVSRIDFPICFGSGAQ